MVVDRLSLQGVQMAPCPETTRKKLAKRGISLPASNLVDVSLAGAQYDTMRHVVEEISGSPEVGIVVAAMGSSAQFQPELTVQPVIDGALVQNERAPILAFPVPHAPIALNELNGRGIPAFRTVESCVDTIATVFTTSAPAGPVRSGLSAATLAQLDKLEPGTASEVQAYEVFKTLGLQTCPSVQLALNEDPPSRLPFEFPVAAKLSSTQLPHKTELGAVHLSIACHAALDRAVTDLKQTAIKSGIENESDRILIQPMVTGLAEVLLGVRRDPVAGMVVSVGMGGRMAEIYDDVSTRRAPVTVATAKAMIGDVRGFALLRGFRNMQPGDLDALADAIAGFSILALHPRVEEAESNPIIIHAVGGGVTLVDGLVVMSGDHGAHAASTAGSEMKVPEL